MGEEMSAVDAAAEVKARFLDRSLLLCGGRFLATRRCLDASSRNPQRCDESKQALLQCMSSHVCEVLHTRVQQCAAAKSDSEQCAQSRAALNRCLHAAYLSLPEPDVSIGSIEARLKELGANVDA